MNSSYQLCVARENSVVDAVISKVINASAPNTCQTNVSSSNQSELGDAQVQIDDDDEADGVADDRLQSDVASESERTGGGGARASISA